jgi:hypothetical protein
MVQDQNAIDELVELLLRVSGDSDKLDEYEIRVDLRIANADLDGTDGLAFNVALKKARLSLDLGGLDVAPGTRFGEPTKSNEVVIKQKTATEKVVTNEAKAGLNASVSASTTNVQAGVGLKGGTKHSTKGKSVSSSTSSENATHLRVKARGGNNWEVSEPNAAALDASYLSDNVLCRVVATRGANSRTVELCAYAKQKDLILTVTNGGSKIPFLSTNHEKMLKILIGKALSALGSQYAGTITFSKSESEIEK